jgi:osmotically-inducible protein OsmY
MADNDRWRNGPERYRYRDEERESWRGESDWGYPRGGRGEPRSGGGFGWGGRDAWYAAGNGDYRPASERGYGASYRERDRFERGRGDEDYGWTGRRERDWRERDFGDSAGYGSGGSALDWRDVEDDRRRWRGREPGFTELAFGQGFGSGYEGRDWSGNRERHGGRRGSGRERDERGFFDRMGDEIASWFGDDEAARRRHRDSAEENRWGHHRGRGPKGYQRSDERIREDINDRLTEDPHVDASEIEVTVADREVTLSGTVSSRFEKRHAEDIADAVSGVTHVQNNLRVSQGTTEQRDLFGPGGARPGAPAGGSSSGRTDFASAAHPKAGTNV